MSRVFTSTNAFSSLQTEAGGNASGRRLGICAAYTALWCKAVFKGTRPLLTKPEQFRAQILQVKYRWDPASPGTDYVNLFQSIDVTASVDFQSLDQDTALSTVSAQTGVYHLSEIGVHTVGAAYTGGKYYFYDCDENGAGGLYEFDTIGDWKALVNQHYAGVSFLGVKVTAAS